MLSFVCRLNIYGQNLHLPYTCSVTSTQIFMKELRMSKRQSENEMAEILKEIINVKNNCDQKTKQQVLETLKKSKQKLQALKSKLKNQKQQQDQIYDTCRKRVHLDQQLVQRKKQMTKQQMLYQFDKQVVQFFACRNKINQAKQIQKSLKQNYYFELYVELYQKSFNISQAIVKNDLRPLKDWCYEHSHYLAKMKSSLQFKLISCGFVNILNNKNGVKAIQFLRKQVATLTLSQTDKQQLNRLTFMVLSAENQSDYQYYSGSDSEGQKKITRVKLESFNDFTITSRKQLLQSNSQNKIKENSSSSSSSNIGGVLQATQQKMGQIFRALGELAQDAQGLLSRALGTNTQSLRSLQPEKIQTSSPDKPNIEQQEIYQAKFDSLSEQQDQIEDKYKQSPQKKLNKKQIKKQKQSLKFEESMMDQMNVIPKVITRKHKLDKNQLRKLLNQTKKQFLLAFSKIYHLSFNTYFDKTLAIGMSVLKTSSCSQIHGAEPGKQRGRCPTCTPQIQRIIKKIPGILQNQSSLICRINGSLMNQANYPIALPNGQIYSIDGLSKSQKNGKYFCPAQSKWFRKQACRKVYLS